MKRSRTKKQIHRWIYAHVGDPMWEWSIGPSEQAVMFFDATGEFAGPPPMTDKEIKKLEASLRRNTR